MDDETHVDNLKAIYARFDFMEKRFSGIEIILFKILREMPEADKINEYLTSTLRSMSEASGMLNEMRSQLTGETAQGDPLGDLARRLEGDRRPPKP
jgi:hypothetical protein